MNEKRNKKYDVLALGELNLDLLMTGLETMPVAGREVIAKRSTLALGSSTAICAAGAARLGLRTAMCSLVGDDDFGKKAINYLNDYGVDSTYVRVDGNRQTGITVSLSGPRDRAMITHLGTIAEVTADYVDAGLLSLARHIHVGSFFLQEKLRPGLPGLFAEARALGVTTSLDAGWDDTECWDYGIMDTLAYTDIFFPNESEAQAITGISDPDKAASALAATCRVAVVKCGRLGAWLCDGKQVIHADTYLKMRAVDTTGAGDSFNAGFIYAFLSGHDYMSCLRYGNACASVSVTRIGGASGCATVGDAETVIKYGSLDGA